jgi:hypothetical protein
MATETFTVVALPHSVAGDAPFHVSLFISPRLTPNRSVGSLKTFELFSAWTDHLLAGEIQLLNQSGKIAVEPLLKQVDPKAWTQVFPGDTLVRSPGPPDWKDRHWRTFRAAEVADNAKLLSSISMLVNPTTPGPADPERDPIVRVMQQIAGDTDTGTGGEVQWTASLDLLVGEGRDGREVSLSTIEKRIGETRGLERALAEQHRARRFYERPESVVADPPPQPIEGETRAELPRPEPDFHERVSLLGDHPGLLRKLGLVIDLKVLDLEALAKSEWLSAGIVTTTQASSQTCRTRCRIDGNDLVTVPRTDEWYAGRLRIGDFDVFRVLDVDADGAALKTDRYLWTIPRLVAAARSGAEVNAATPAHRTGGFTVVRTQRAIETQNRMGTQSSIGKDVAAGKAPLLDTEDVSQGYRVEVYEETTNTWYTVHARRVDVEILGYGKVMKDVADQGFVQTTTASETAGVEESPVHVHEAAFSWGGWSLSAPRPGKRVRHEGGEEIVEDPDTDPDPVTPVVIHSRVEPGTLPRLRYGRSYAFRAWGVDLAGNTRPHDLAPVPPVGPPVLERVAALLPPAKDFSPSPGFETVLRGEAAAAVVRRRSTDKAQAVEPGELTEMLNPNVVTRLRARRFEPLTRMGRSDRLAEIDRAAAVDRHFEALLLDPDAPSVAGVAVFSPAVVLGGLGRPVADPEIDELLTVSPIRPFLRWEPVQPPAVVARHANSPGESLLQLVIRSGVTQDPDTLAISVTPPGPYNTGKESLRYRAASERHIAPPKTSQSEAELHAVFDDAIGSTDPDEHNRMLAVAAREAGTFFDEEVPTLDNPNVSEPQLGIGLVHDPGVPESTLKTLPLPPGEPPAPGQYVVHDTDDLTLPYLPDPLARGISLVFPDAGRDRQLIFPFGTEGFTARYRGRWPEPAPFRLVLNGGEALSGRLTGRTLTLTLPPGDVQRFRLSSHLDIGDLDLFGFWRLLPPILRDNPVIAEAAADGWMWIFTPFDRVSLVHAVPRPLERPDVTGLGVARTRGSTESSIVAGVDVHGPSTELLTAEASWTEYTDDVTLPIPSTADVGGVGFTVVVRPEEDVAVLAGPLPDFRLEVRGFGPVWLHQAVHRWGDTKHRMVTYQFRASTRYREYFDPSSLVPDYPGDDGQSVIGEPVAISVPSSAPPAAPIVHSVLPLLRWEVGPEPEQPMATRRSRRAGVRIYIERPWYSSGEGELLAVLVAPLGLDNGLEEHVSQWGADPIWRSREVVRRGMWLEFDHLIGMFGLDQAGEARPVAPPVTMPLASDRAAPKVTVLGYQPQYNEERGLWYVDVAIDPGDVFWPFVRLSIARYQPDSIDGCHLSKPVKCDFVQLLPERTASVSRTDVRHVRVVVSGSVGTRGGDEDETFPPPLLEYNAAVLRNRRLIARLQRVDPDLATDLGWRTVDAVELVIRGYGRTEAEAGWVGELSSPVDIPLRTPGSNARWRVTIEEWELLLGDPADLGEHGPREEERRLIYADELLL